VTNLNVEVVIIGKSHKVPEGSLEMEGNVGNFLTGRLSCTMSLFLRVLQTIRRDI
jgi:hypothetical protein